MVLRSSVLAASFSLVLLALASGCANDGTISDGPHWPDDEEQGDDGGGDESDGPLAEERDASRAPSDHDGGVSRDSSVRAGDAALPRDSGEVAAVGTSKTMHVEGRRILDTCGQPWQARGVEQLAGKAFSADGTMTGLASQLISTGSNAVRLLPQIAELKPADIDRLLAAFAAEKVVVYLSPGDRSWFKRSDVREVLKRHEKGLIIDAFQEPDYDDVPRWKKESKAAIAELRSAGYVAPLTVLSNQYGRDLGTALEHGQEVFDADPLHNTIIGWQAYWGNTGWYQRDSGMTLKQGVEKSAAKGFPVQVGIDLYADANDVMDYVAVMAAAQQQGIGWLWWNFWNQWDSLGNNASLDGTATRLTPAGQTFMHSDPNSIARTSKKACFR